MIKKLYIAFIVLILTSCSSVPLVGGGGFKLRPYETVTLQNGLKVLLVRDDSLPSLSLMMLVKVGGSFDPKGKAGLSSLVAETLDKGTSKRTTLELADSLGQVGASFGASASADYTMISASALSFHEAQLLTDFSEIVLEPSFSESEVRRVRREVLASLQRLVDEPDDFAGVIFQSYLFGDHPYAKSAAGNAKDVKSIQRKDIIRFYKQYYRPNNAMLAVVGKFSDNIVEQLNQKFAGWQQRPVDNLSFPAAPQISGIDLKLIDKGDLKQSQIRIGHVGIRRTDPDFLALRVANTILGGAFSSRLMDEIREKRGLTYSIGSFFDARRVEGPFIVSTFTRHEKVGETLRETLRILKELRERGITTEELSTAKAYLKGVFPQSLETAEAYAQNLLLLQFYGIGDDYLRNYLRNIDRLSEKDINTALQKHLKPDQLKILVYSPSQQVLTQVKGIGPVKVTSYRDYL